MKVTVFFSLLNRSRWKNNGQKGKIKGEKLATEKEGKRTKLKGYSGEIVRSMDWAVISFLEEQDIMQRFLYIPNSFKQLYFMWVKRTLPPGSCDVVLLWILSGFPRSE